MNGYPEYRSRQDMIEHGWKVEAATALCRNCGGEINWATTPNGKKLPLDTNSTQPHFKSCGNGGALPGVGQKSSSLCPGRVF
jgi:hypothetical protein